MNFGVGRSRQFWPRSGSALESLLSHPSFLSVFHFHQESQAAFCVDIPCFLPVPIAYVYLNIYLMLASYLCCPTLYLVRSIFPLFVSAHVLRSVNVRMSIGIEYNNALKYSYNPLFFPVNSVHIGLPDSPRKTGSRAPQTPAQHLH